MTISIRTIQILKWRVQQWVEELKYRGKHHIERHAVTWQESQFGVRFEVLIETSLHCFIKLANCKVSLPLNLPFHPTTFVVLNSTPTQGNPSTLLLNPVQPIRNFIHHNISPSEAVIDYFTAGKTFLFPSSSEQQKQELLPLKIHLHLRPLSRSHNPMKISSIFSLFRVRNSKIVLLIIEGEDKCSLIMQHLPPHFSSALSPLGL